VNNNKEFETIKDVCGFISIKNIPSPLELEKFYSKHYFQDPETRPKSYQISYDDIEMKHSDLMNDLLFHSIYTVRSHWKKNPGSLLEVGVGEGHTFSRAKFYGWDVNGIDFNDYGVKKFNPHMIDQVEKGNPFDIIEKYAKENKKFDVIIIKHILEHTIDPRGILKSLKALLSKDGILLVTLPNDYSKLQMKALELGHITHKFWLEPPQHLHYFNSENIRLFLDEMKFSIIDLYSSFPIDFFLFNPNSNYIMDEKKGKSAHRARIELEILMSENNLTNYHKLCQLMVKCNVGRNFTVLLESKQ